MQEHCVENNVDLLHIRQISKSEAHLKAFHCVFKFDEEKVELPDFLPERYGVKILSHGSCPLLAEKSGSKLTI